MRTIPEWERRAGESQRRAKALRSTLPPQRTRLWLGIALSCLIIGVPLLLVEVTADTPNFLAVGMGLFATVAGQSMLIEWFQGRRR